MYKIDRCYLEITNSCNLSCPFCPGNKRPKHSLTTAEFDCLTDKLTGHIRFLYFHLMGEPLLHPDLPFFLNLAREKGFIPVLTTNGTLLYGTTADTVVAAQPYKVQISLQSTAAKTVVLNDYINKVSTFARQAASNGIIIVLRLWNKGGDETNNGLIEDMLSNYFPQPWTEHTDSFRLAERIFLEYDKIFDWPGLDKKPYEENVFCHALRNQIGILSDGTVVPCCLDHEGNISLGNLFNSTLQDILDGQRARNIYQGFTRHEAVEPICKRCGYANVTHRFHIRS